MLAIDLDVRVPALTPAEVVLDRFVEAARRRGLHATRVAVLREPRVTGPDFLCGLIMLGEREYVVYLGITATTDPAAAERVAYARLAAGADMPHFRVAAPRVRIELTITGLLRPVEDQALMEALRGWFAELSQDESDHPYLSFEYPADHTTVMRLVTSERLLSAGAQAERAQSKVEEVLASHPRGFYAYSAYVAWCLYHHLCWPRRRLRVSVTACQAGPGSTD
jgi:hypothetical protein